jgi:hypothetical protein
MAGIARRAGSRPARKRAPGPPFRPPGATMITQALARADGSQLCLFRSRPWKARRRSIRTRSPVLGRAVTNSAKTGGTATLTERDFAMLACIGVSEDLLKEAGTHRSLTVPGPIQTGPKAGFSGSSHSHNARHASKTFLRANPRLRWRSDDFHPSATWTASTASISGRAELLPEPLHGVQEDGNGHRTSGGREGRNATLLRRGSLAGPTPRPAELFSSRKAHG